MKQSGNPRTEGKRGKTRYKFKKTSPKVSVNDVMRDFDLGDRVAVVVDSSHHSGLPPKNFHGLTGVIVGKRGRGFEINIMKGNEKAAIITTAPHLKKLSDDVSATATKAKA